MSQADYTNENITTKLKANLESYTLISKTKQELSNMIPHSTDASQFANAPPVMVLKKCLDDLDVIVEERGKINDEGVQKL